MPTSVPASVDAACLILYSTSVPTSISGIQVMPFPPGTDLDYASGLISFVMIEFDRNSQGALPSLGGALMQKFTRSEVYPNAYRCRVVKRKTVKIMYEAQPTDAPRYRVLFANSLNLDRRYRLVVLDPVTLTPVVPTMRLFVEGPASDSHLMNHHWVIDTHQIVF